jgi:hypothetical protein
MGLRNFYGENKKAVLVSGASYVVLGSIILGFEIHNCFSNGGDVEEEVRPLEAESVTYEDIGGNIQSDVIRNPGNSDSVELPGIGYGITDGPPYQVIRRPLYSTRNGRSGLVVNVTQEDWRELFDAAERDEIYPLR